MVKAGCVALLLLSSTLTFCCVTAFHPIAQSLSSKPPEMMTKNPDEGHLENESTLVKYYDENQALEDSAIEELKRAYGRNYLRFGRDNDEKRGHDRNFLRFGRGDNPLLSALYLPTDATEEEKRASRNFLRFGRNNQRNFLRFGKSSPLEFGFGIEDPETPDEEEVFKRGDNRNFLRFGKAADRNFLRFGRSVEHQLNKVCPSCIEKDDQMISSSKSSLSLPHKNRIHLLSEDQNSQSTATKSRSKRSVSAFYDELMSMPQAPLAWPSQYGTYLSDPQSGVQNQGGPQELQKRSHSRNFLRYGRDPLDLHFLRFGKRGPTEGSKSQENQDDEEEFPRYVRARSNKNFIRFG